MQGGGELRWESQVDDSRLEVTRQAILRKHAFWLPPHPSGERDLPVRLPKHEQGQNAKEIPVDPLIEQADAEIDRLKRAPGAPEGGTGSVPGSFRRLSGAPAKGLVGSDQLFGGSAKRCGGSAEAFGRGEKRFRRPSRGLPPAFQGFEGLPNASEGGKRLVGSANRFGGSAKPCGRSAKTSRRASPSSI